MPLGPGERGSPTRVPCPIVCGEVCFEAGRNGSDLLARLMNNLSPSVALFSSGCWERDCNVNAGRCVRHIDAMLYVFMFVTAEVVNLAAKTFL